MTEKSWRVLLLLPWLALPLTLGCYAALWSRLPGELAVQFDLSSGAVTNTMGRTASLLLDAAILLFVLCQFTYRLWGTNGRDMRALVVAYYGATVFITVSFLAILKYNL
jgi:hypothetical protein